MPNDVNHIISQEQKRKAINFRVAVAQGSLSGVKKYCDAYTLNSSDAKDNTALHVVSEKGHDEILKFLFKQPHLIFHSLNAEDNKAVDLVKKLSTAQLWQEVLQIEKNLVQASVFRQKYLLKKNYDFIVNSNNHANESFTLEDLSQINAMVKQTFLYGAPDWKPERFPHQQASAASLWKKKHANYYRVAVLQDLLGTIENQLSVVPMDNTMRVLIIRIIHSALAEVIQAGRCYEQTAVVFCQMLMSGKKASLAWMHADNLQWVLSENLKNFRGHSFIILDKVGDREPETWTGGLLIDPMDDKIAPLKECAPQVMENLMRIIGQPDQEHIQLSTSLISSLPLKGKDHALIAETLEKLRPFLKGYFELNWHLYWPGMKKNYPPLKERMVRTWLEKCWELLAKKTDIHAMMADNLHLNEVQDSLDRLEQRVEIIKSSERLAHYLHYRMKNS